MTPASARGLIEKLASNSQQFNMRSDVIVVRGVHDVVASDSTEHKKLESKIDALTTLVSQLASNQKSAPPPAKVCGICTSINHPTDACPSLQDSSTGPDAPQAYAANIYNNRPPQKQQNYDLSSNRYNPGWRNHPNLRWGNPQQQQNPPPFQNNPSSSTYQPPQQRPPPAPAAQLAQPSTSSEPSLEELVRQMTIQNMQFQQETRASIRSLTNQMGQMATQLNQAQSQNSNKLPSQTVQNLKNVSAITLRSGKQIDIPTAVPPPPSAHVPVPSSAPEQIHEPVGAQNFHAGGPSSSTNSSDFQEPPIPLP
ncbi:uncharacterized protein LOC109794093 [Cajanus cajan]|uniref:uncharacterized protein LOC109794093 n=1 Tax=Cajanus cajan TaxID=3821 RepID=UPI00098D86F5|nr:uncharacterized protein LOC109794093 [Cajanus cajan]